MSEPIGRIPPYLRKAPSGTAPPGQPAGLRPFVLTAGRVTAADPSIDVETQVTLRRQETPWPGRPPLGSLGPEMQAMVALCVTPMSVAEISARLGLHLGVTKILVADLRAAGFLDVHVTDPLTAGTILRVMHGLRTIS